jgi:chromosome segregation ATPase
MNFFETLRRRSADGSHATERASGHLENALADVGGAQRREGYTRARLTELLPDLNEIARLEIAERNAAASLAGAQTALDLLRQIRSRLSARPNFSSAEMDALGRQETDTQNRIRESQIALERVTADLTRIRAVVATREAELHQQFGIPNSD